MNTKGRETRFVADVLAREGVKASIIDLSLRAHDVGGANVTGDEVAKAAGSTWPVVGERSRQDAAALMVDGGGKLVLERFAEGGTCRCDRPRRCQRHHDGLRHYAGAALSRAKGDGEHSRRHRGRAVVCG